MLYPQQNHLRNVLDLSGFWEFEMDPADAGEAAGWFNGLPAARAIAVPGSWNEQFQDTRDYLGRAWYLRDTFVPAGWQGERIFIRVGSANYAAKVWINGHLVGQHEGGHLPFAFEITDHVLWDQPNTIAIQVDAELTPTRVPPGNVSQGGMSAFMRNFPATSFDFFPYAGLHRPVVLFTLPAQHIEDITVVTDIEDTTGTVQVTVCQQGQIPTGQVHLSGAGFSETSPLTFANGVAQARFTVPQARFWSPEDPHLYRLTATLGEAGQVTDHYTLDVGIRTVAVRDNQLLLNGRPIFLKGFGKHEDFPIHGRGLNRPLIVKDYALLHWIGANSYRTAHYPYSEEAMRMADREGILIIGEIPAVGLFFEDSAENIQARLRQCRQQLEELIARDKNHPSVIIWSVANEPFTMQGGLAGMFGGNPQPHPAAKPFFAELFDLARRLDPTRLVTLVSMAGLLEESLEFADLVCLNRYHGWYTESGQPEAGFVALEAELDQLYQKFRKPIFISEFGADTVAGMHSDPPEMFTEEYQVAILRGHLDLAERKDYLAGLHVWNFADFKTSQAIMRVGGMNLKGVFTRDRRPKMAAHFLRERWKQL